MKNHKNNGNNVNNKLDKLINIAVQNESRWGELLVGLKGSNEKRDKILQTCWHIVEEIEHERQKRSKKIK